MRAPRTYAAVAVALLALGAIAVRGRPATADGCAARFATSAYAGSVGRAVASKRDLWGDRLLRAPGGPTYAAARGFLAPLTGALQWEGHPLTATGSYYVPFAFPFSSQGSTVFALHVADGSGIVTRRIGGPSLAIYVGSGSERFGSCADRVTPARLARDYLPILRTEYRDAAGVRYRQESFVGRTFGARSVVSFVRLDVDTRGTAGATVRFAPSPGAGARLIGAQLHRIPGGRQRTIYAVWLHASAPARYVHANAKTYAAARATVVRFWQSRLSRARTFSVPEPAVQDAERGILVQLIAYGWRYSIGNPYEELSYAESLDAAEVAAAYGYASVARSILDLSLARMRLRPWRFTAFRGAHILSSAATYVRLTHDRAFLRKATPELEQLVARIAARRVESGRLHPEPLSTDLETEDVDSVPGQVEAVEGLLAIARVWSANGYGVQAVRARALARGIDAALRPALKRAWTRLPDGSLFVPDQLPQRPFDRLTATRAGSYWNLVMPSAFGSGWFAAGSPAARGIVRYLLAHGSRLLGVPRTYARTVYGSEPGAGLAQVYGLGTSRFLADNDEPDQLVLSLYGMLAAGMTEGTYISGEAVSLLPVRGAYARAMFMPPNTGANASYLGTLRELLVHERRNRLGAPAGLDLAFSTPRGWLADGKRIDVRAAPTSFGPVTYSLERRGASIIGRLVLPPHAHARLRLRLPAGERLGRVVLGPTAVTPRPGGTIALGGAGRITLRATVIRPG